MSSVMSFFILAIFSSIHMNICTASPIVAPVIKFAPKNAYPFIASIQKRITVDILRLKKQFQHYCGGSVVTRKHILTAAHCFGPKLRIKKYRVMIGSNDLENGRVYQVRTWLKYDSWILRSNKLSNYTDNDLAIVELSTVVDYGVELAKITTASNDDLRDAIVVTAGWGDNVDNTKPRFMVEANLNMLSHGQCMRNLEIAHNATARYMMDNNYFCTNGDPYVLLNCGDSGSPVFWKKNEIIGVNHAVCPKRMKGSYTKKEQNLHIDVRLYADFITAVTDNCTIEENIKPKIALSCWPFDNIHTLVETPQVCSYIFVVERYITMNKACYDCPNNATDCFRPHCIVTDGVSKLVYSINRQIPGPPIEVCENDMIEIEVRNRMASESTTLHWHGFKQLNTGFMDGVPYVTQCPILPGQNFTYRFYATSTGTFFYHAHMSSQKSDGLYGALIVHRKSQHKEIKGMNIYDDHIVVISDWLHKSAEETDLMESQKGSAIVVDSLLINGLGHQNVTRNQMSSTKSKSPLAEFIVKKGKNYRFRVIGAGSEDCPIRMTIDGHEMTVTSLDSNAIEPVTVDALTIWPGERIDFLLKANEKPDYYWMRFVGGIFCSPNGNQLAILRYDNIALAKPKGSDNPNIIQTPYPRVYNPYNAGEDVASCNRVVVSTLKSLEPNDKSLTQKIPDHKIYVSFDFYKIDNHKYHRKGLYGYNQTRADGRFETPQLNHISMKLPKVPLMSQWEQIDESTLCNAENPPKNLDCTKDHCQCTHSISVRMNSVVELILVDEGGGNNVNHPLHLHGHFFRLMASERLNGTVSIDTIKKLDKAGQIDRMFDRAPLKDTMKVPYGGYNILRFYANNPGYWLFHCHIDAHMNRGMMLVFKVGEHYDCPEVPEFFPQC